MIAACVERVTGTMHERLDSMGAENSLKQQPQPHIEKSYGRHLPPGTVILRPAGNGGSCSVLPQRSLILSHLDSRPEIHADRLSEGIEPCW